MTEPSSDAPLKWDLFVTSGIPTVTPDPPPGERRRFFSPISSTLIYGKRDAVLVDGLVVAGDAAYNGVHQLLAESNPQKRREWIAALDKIESLKPRAVIAGHKRPGNEDSPRIIEETRQYIRDFDGIAETARTALELYDQMLKLHPLRMNVNALWTSARAIKG